MVAETIETGPPARCLTRALTVWSGKCGCPACVARVRRMQKIKRVGGYRRVEPVDAYKVLDDWIRRGYDGVAAVSAINVPGMCADTVREWLKARREGREVRIGPGGCQVLVDAGEPTTGRLSPVIAVRKLRALARMGYTAVDIARMVQVGTGLPCSGRLLQAIRNGESLSITVEVNRAVNAVYTRLLRVPAPDDRAHNLMRSRARRARWISPMDWEDIDDPLCEPERNDVRRDGLDQSRHHDSLDPVLVAALVAGRKEGVKPTRAERVAVVRVLRQRGKSYGEITKLTGIGHPKRYADA